MKYLTAIGLFTILAFENAHADDLTVQISKTQGKGILSCAVFSEKNGFPMESKKALHVVVGERADQRSGTCRFSDLSKGKYAVAISEDLNSNGKLDTTFVGFPKEPWGVSNNAPMHTFGPPTFEEASFELTPNLNIKIDLND